MSERFRGLSQRILDAATSIKPSSEKFGVPEVIDASGGSLGKEDSCNISSMLSTMAVRCIGVGHTGMKKRFRRYEPDEQMCGLCNYNPSSERRTGFFAECRVAVGDDSSED